LSGSQIKASGFAGGYLLPILINNATLNRVFFRLAALLVVAIARYDSSSRLARRKNPSISSSRY
jgi:hypothetical protein